MKRRLFHDDEHDTEETKGSTKTKGGSRKNKNQQKPEASPKIPEKKTRAKKDKKKVEKEQQVEKEEKNEVEKGSRPKLPTFSHCQIVAYWSRDAVALKVAGGGKSGWTQAGVKKDCYFSLVLLPLSPFLLDEQ